MSSHVPTHKRAESHDLSVFGNAHAFVVTVLRDAALAVTDISTHTARIAPDAALADFAAMLVDGAGEGVGIAALEVGLQAFIAFLQLGK